MKIFDLAFSLRSSGPSPRVAAALGLVVAVASGCGGNVEVSSSGGGGAGGTTVSGGGGAGGTTVTGGGGTGGVDPACQDFSAGSFDMNIVTPDGLVWDCAKFMQSATGDLVVDGAVTKSSETSLEIDACGPAADCLPILYELNVSAPGLVLTVPVGAYVHLQANVYIPWGCEQRLMITNLPVWQGTPNPVDSSKRLYMAGSEGSASVLDGAPFTLDKVQLACGDQPDTGCGMPGHYKMRFTPVGQPGSAVDVPPGQFATLALPDSPPMAAFNLKSYETGYCDDYWNWGYFVGPTGIK